MKLSKSWVVVFAVFIVLVSMNIYLYIDNAFTFTDQVNQLLLKELSASKIVSKNIETITTSFYTTQNNMLNHWLWVVTALMTFATIIIPFISLRVNEKAETALEKLKKEIEKQKESIKTYENSLAKEFNNIKVETISAHVSNSILRANLYIVMNNDFSACKSELLNAEKKITEYLNKEKHYKNRILLVGDVYKSMFRFALMSLKREGENKAKISEIKELCENYLTKYPSDIDPYITISDILLKIEVFHGHTTASDILLLTKPALNIIKEFPSPDKEFFLYLNIAEAYMLSNNFDEAISYLEHALETPIKHTITKDEHAEFNKVIFNARTHYKTDNSILTKLSIIETLLSKINSQSL